jgi:hypothetical protein
METKHMPEYSHGPFYQAEFDAANGWLTLNLGAACSKAYLSVNAIAAGSSRAATELAANQMAFIAEAFNVSSETGLSPRQLKEQRDEFVGACLTLIKTDDLQAAIDEARAALAQVGIKC